MKLNFDTLVCEFRKVPKFDWCCYW